MKIFSPLFIFFAIIFSYLRTSPPTIYTVDSPELSSVAYTLGIAHAPSYPLYSLVAHLFSQIPISSQFAYRLNLLSILAMAVAVVLLYFSLDKVLNRKLIAGISSLIFAWSYYVWIDGIVAEVYAFQLFFLALMCWSLQVIYEKPNWNRVLLTAMLYGLAVAAHPATIFFAPALIYAFLQCSITWPKRLVAGGLSLLIFLLCLLYFPIRYAADPAVNSLGEYNEQGEFETLNLQSITGLWEMLSASQFQGVFPHSLAKLIEGIWWFCGNFLGFGIVLGGFGLWELWQKFPKVFWLWFLAFVPYFLYFASYGAVDRDMMLLPTYWLWIFPLAYSLSSWGKNNYERLALLLIPCLFLGLNFSRVDVSQNTERYDLAVEAAASFPQNALVFGTWGDIVALEYLQIVEAQRPDVHYYNLFFFGQNNSRLETFLENRLENGFTIIFLNASAVRLSANPRFQVLAFSERHHQIRLR